MEKAYEIVDGTINGFIWNIVPWFLVLAGIYFGFRTLFVQVRLLPSMFRAVAETPKGKDREGRDLDADYGGISAFKAFTISAASRVGTGNIAGVALAISIGGPGAVFWMWMIALIGGATSFVESTLAQLWKTKDPEGSYHGGPAYYMTRGLGWRPVAIIFSIFLAFTYGFVYNAIQTNSIVEAVGGSLDNNSNTLKGIVAVVIAALTAAIIFGGVTRIASATQVIVPFMAGAYVIIGLIVVIVNIGEVPNMIATIVGSALGLREVAGATLAMAFMHGMRRGLFSNEAGMGSAPNAAATATVSHPVKQGLVQTLGVYFDTLLVCSITAFIVLLGPQVTYGKENIQGAALTQAALADSVGAWGAHAITFILFFLAFSSVIGNYYLAQANIEYLTKSKAVMTGFRVLVIGFVFFGAFGSLPLVWALGDTMAGSLAIINIIAIVPLGGVAIKLLKNFNEQRRQGVDPVFHRDMLPELKNVEFWDGSDPVTRRSIEDRITLADNE
ncbi:alanine/glycine:cation symporter family protein [Corynebacterium sanguinis]|uniref:alanine/glycine:cation symporter family protein n=2 Tax=Corynebacterium sanguinis TaxID=2594913 RepID=UPI001184E748|nr:alanine/glycine:cation symporter family protein [Corynebacterium sanguinis]MCT1412690.1 alanine:cation symporter family protein [Corynebacterium sanguinis]MCT1444372.1 alanine:cation symporter family protein [Corynebacterium sanguinis]MCT1462649.1 alanine:cation symporter family protein [Corynebacterium sanguinis]MCT1498378.1 alanine:cation symporter family protein [Corynebacterium sanguinis]MCT1596446.1 alanine:cation symporter family protein [Corynebacterium sanguinis]